MIHYHYRRIVSVLFATTIVIAIISLTQVEAWDGGFMQAEFRLTFVDSTGKAIDGVKLTVIDDKGSPSYCYPITDYQEGTSLSSGSDGILTFHHVNLSPEFSGKVRYLFFVIPIGNRSAPKYYCRFSKDGVVIHEALFNDYFGFSKISRQELDQMVHVRASWRDMNLYCHSLSLSDHLKIQNRIMDDELEFPLIKRTITIQR